VEELRRNNVRIEHMDMDLENTDAPQSLVRPAVKAFSVRVIRRSGTKKPLSGGDGIFLHAETLAV
jgi:hypothetical protein